MTYASRKVFDKKDGRSGLGKAMLMNYCLILHLEQTILSSTEGLIFIN